MGEFKYKPNPDKEYWAIDPPEPYEDYKIRHMVWIGTPQNFKDLEADNIYMSYKEAYNVILDY